MRYIFIAIVLAGIILLFTMDNNTSNSSPGYYQSGIFWEDKIEIASGDAYQGIWRMNDSDFRYVDAPSVHIKDNGVPGITWVDQSQKDVLFQMYDADGNPRFDEPVNVSRSPAIFSWLPRVVISENNANNVYILWQEIVFSGGSHGGEIFFSRSIDGGRTFSEPVNLSNTPAGAAKGRLTARYWDNGSLDIVEANDGSLFVAWTEYEGRLWFRYSTDRGESFSDPLHVAGNNIEPARGPSIASGENGNVYLVWTVGEDPSADIRFARSTDGGRSFSEPRTVFKSDGHSDAPKIAVDSNEIIHLVYAESPAGMFRRYQIRYTRLDQDGNALEGSRELSEALSDDFNSMNFPSLALDDSDNIYIVWELYPDRTNRPLGLGFTYSGDGGETFDSPSVIPGTDDPALGFNGSLQGLLMRKLSVNNEGEIAIVNNTFRQNQSSHIWLIRGKIGKQRLDDPGKNY